jgi:uncharacterized protein YodC (DUF2158 family)
MSEQQFEAAQDFSPGDVVCLKSGGPRMTVESVGEQTTGGKGVWVVWFDKVGNKQVVQRDTFAPVLLQKYEPFVGGMVSIY